MLKRLFTSVSVKVLDIFSTSVIKSTFQLSIKTKGLGLLSVLKHRSKRCLWIILFTQANLRSFD